MEPPVRKRWYRTSDSPTVGPPADLPFPIRFGRGSPVLAEMVAHLRREGLPRVNRRDAVHLPISGHCVERPIRNIEPLPVSERQVVHVSHHETVPHVRR